MSNTLNKVLACDYTIVEDDGRASYNTDPQLPSPLHNSRHKINYDRSDATGPSSDTHTGRDTTHVSPGRASPDIFSWWLPEDDVSPDDRLLEHLEPLNYDQDMTRSGAVPHSTSDIQLLRLPVVSTEGSVAVASSSHKLSNQKGGENSNGTNADANSNSNTRSFYERQRQQAGATTASNPSTVCINQAADYLHRRNGSFNGNFMANTVIQDRADAGTLGCHSAINAPACSNSTHFENANNCNSNVGLNPFVTEAASNGCNKASCFKNVSSSPEHPKDMQYFQKMISSLSMFKEKYGHTNVPKIASWFLLGSWVEQMRRRKKVQGLRDRGIQVAKDLSPLSHEHTSILDAMGFKWQAPDFYENERIIEQIKAQEAREPSSMNSLAPPSPSSEDTRNAGVGNQDSRTNLQVQSPPQDTFRKSLLEQEVDIPTPIPYDPCVQSQQSLDMGTFERISLPDMMTNGSNSGQNMDYTTNGANHSIENYFHAGLSHFHQDVSSRHPMQNLSAPNSNQLNVSHLQNLSLNRNVPTSRFVHDSEQGQQPPRSSHSGNFVGSEGSQSFPSFHSVTSSSHQLPHGQHPNPFSAYYPFESCSWNQSAYNYSVACGNPFDVYSCQQSIHSHPLPSTSSDHFNGYHPRPHVFPPTEVYSSHCSSRSFTAQSVRSHGNLSSNGNTASMLSFNMNRKECQFEAVEALRNQMMQSMIKKPKAPKLETQQRGKKRKSPVSHVDLERETACSASSRLSRASREESSEQIWQYHFSKLKAYFAEKGNCEVPARYDDDAKLGHWVMTQRRQYHLMKNGKRARINQSRIDQLNSLNFKWTIKKENKVQWDERFNQLAEFKKANGHCLVPQRFPSNPPLGTW
jgi:Helicase associated domain.